MRLSPVVRPYRRWRRRGVVLAIIGFAAGLYRCQEWANDWQETSYIELNQRLLVRDAFEASRWVIYHRGCPTTQDLLQFADEEGIDMYGQPIAITCDAYGAALVHSAGPDREFGTADDQISSRSRLTPLEGP